LDNNVFRNLSYGVYVVSSYDKDHNRHVGCVANSVMQITSSPATIAVSINHDNYTNACIKKFNLFAISILTEKTDPQIIGTFGFKSSRDTNKFENIEHTTKEGVNILSDSCGYVICKVIDKMETETHTVFLASVIDGELLKNEEPMTYSYYHKVIKGKSPKAAPTYIEEANDKPIYKCSICGYEYDGDIPFEELPDDYVCPICGVPKNMFKKK